MRSAGRASLWAIQGEKPEGKMVDWILLLRSIISGHHPPGSTKKTLAKEERRRSFFLAYSTS